jgi:hypothetical protein
MAIRYPSIPEPTGNAQTDLEVLRALKEAVEMQLGYRGPANARMVSVQKLLDAGIITVDQAALLTS